MARFTNQAQLRYGDESHQFEHCGRRDPGGTVGYQDGSPGDLRTEG